MNMQVYSPSDLNSNNAMEKTLPVGVSKHETFICLETLFSSLTQHPFAQHYEQLQDAWTADGGVRREEMVAQMTQHGKALRMATEWSRDKSFKLTARHVGELHTVLMLNSVHGGIPGEIRTLGAFTDGHIYPEASMETLQPAVDKYHASVLCDHHFLVSATVLFYEVIQVHPFEDGNGRLCLLLLNYALCVAGFPFAVPLTSGHSKARKHYIMAIRNAQNKEILAMEPNEQLMDLICLVLKSCTTRLLTIRPTSLECSSSFCGGRRPACTTGCGSRRAPQAALLALNHSQRAKSKIKKERSISGPLQDVWPRQRTR